MRKPALLTALLGIVPGLSFGQTPSPRFEVASVKPMALAVEGYRGGCHGTNSVFTPAQQASAPSPGSCVIRAARLSHQPVSLTARKFPLATLARILTLVS